MDEPEDSVRVVRNTVRGLSELQIDFICYIYFTAAKNVWQFIIENVITKTSNSFFLYLYQY